jgi:UDP-N-acetylmuramyl pentapeptide phosphotransferase/UDP-N-acetylglucosamine-1-phosphate transferase
MFESQLITASVAFIGTVLLLATFLHIRIIRNIVDVPNQRSLHTRPIPRIGGVPVMIGTIGAYVSFSHNPLWPILLPLLGLIIISLVDDIADLPVGSRFFVHVVAVIFFLCNGLGHPPVNLIIIVLVPVMVWMINLYNFMDGSDGLAGGMTMIGFLSYGAAALLENQSDIALLSFSIAGSAAGFLTYNFPPAKVFLGDSGSIPLGFAAGSIGFLGWKSSIWPVWFPLLVFSPFIIDASVTLAMRFIRGEKFWEAHREHYYQRMVRMGWGHRRTALLEYVLMICVALSALAALPWAWEIQYSLLAAWTVVYLSLARTVDLAWSKYQSVGLASNSN